MEGSSRNHRHRQTFRPLCLEQLEDRHLLAGLASYAGGVPLAPASSIEAVAPLIPSTVDSQPSMDAGQSVGVVITAQTGQNVRRALDRRGLPQNPTGQLFADGRDDEEFLSVPLGGGRRSESNPAISTDRMDGREDEPLANGFTSRAGASSDIRPDRDDDDAGTDQDGTAVEVPDRDDRIAARRDPSAGADGLSGAAETMPEASESDPRSLSQLPAASPVQFEMVAHPPATTSPILLVCTGDQSTTASSAMNGASDEITSRDSPSAGPTDSAATAQPQIREIPSASLGTESGTSAISGAQPVGGRLPFDLAAIEQGAAALLSRLNPTSDKTALGAATRLVVWLAGFWVAYEFVRLWVADSIRRLGPTDMGSRRRVTPLPGEGE
jgi:hypothetical protein